MQWPESFYQPMDEPELCEKHGCEIRVSGCPECKAESEFERNEEYSLEMWKGSIDLW